MPWVYRDLFSPIQNIGIFNGIQSLQSPLYNGHLLITVTFVLSRCILLYIFIRFSGHLFNVVGGHHLYVIFSVEPLYNGKFILKIIPEVISEDRYFSQMYQKS